MHAALRSLGQCQAQATQRTHQSMHSTMRSHGYSAGHKHHSAHIRACMQQCDLLASAGHKQHSAHISRNVSIELGRVRPVGSRAASKSFAYSNNLREFAPSAKIKPTWETFSTIADSGFSSTISKMCEKDIVDKNFLKYVKISNKNEIS